MGIVAKDSIPSYCKSNGRIPICSHGDGGQLQCQLRDDGSNRELAAVNGTFYYYYFRILIFGFRMKAMGIANSEFRM